MATLNELGRNSSSITYGPSTTGADYWPTFALVDQWMRNDTWAGAATASGVNVVAASVPNTAGTIWTTQARVGDVIMIAGQQRTIASIVSDTSMTVTQSFSPAITVASAVKVISTPTYNNANNQANTQASGYGMVVVRNNTNGVVSCTNQSTVITGIGTYFLAEATNSVVLQSVAGTCAIDAQGNITGTSTSFLSQQGNAAGLFPGDSIAVTSNGAVYYFQVGSVSSDTIATLTFAPQFGAIASGATIQKAANGQTGRTIQINGRMRTVTSITSNTVMTVNIPMDFTDSNLRYKTYPRGTVSNCIGATGIGATSVSISTTTLTVAGVQTGLVQIGSYAIGANISNNTQITGQLTGGTTVATPTATGTSGTNTITVSSAANILVGQFVTGTGIPTDTYVGSISGTTVTLVGSSFASPYAGSVPAPRLLTANATGTYNFYTAGLGGTYSVNNSQTSAAAQAYFTSIVGTNANFAWDVQSGDQIWINDELRTIAIPNNYALQTSSGARPDNYAVISDYVTVTGGALAYTGTPVHALRQLVPQTGTGTGYRRDDSYITGNAQSGSGFTSDLRVGDDIIIDGTETTVQAIVASNQIKVSNDFTHTTAVNNVAAITTAASAPSALQNGMTVTNVTGIAVGQYVTGPGLTSGVFVSAIGGSSGSISATTAGTNYVTVSSTSGLFIGETFVVTGASFGGLSAGTYYILTISPGTNQITLSTTLNGSVVSLTTATPGGSVTFAAGSASTLTLACSFGGYAFVGAGNTTGNYTFSNGSTIYKKKKIHGYVLEGTREGGQALGNYGKFSFKDTIGGTAGTNTVQAGSNVVTVTTGASFAVNNLVKIEGGGGTPYPITGQANALAASTALTGVNTLFTTQLHIGAEIVVGGQHNYVTAITSDTSLTVANTWSLSTITNTNSSTLPIYRTVPLYTYVVSVATNTVTLGHTIKNALYASTANSPMIYTTTTSADFIEYVYSTTNVSAEATATLSNTSPDRKYVAFRYWPLWQNAYNQTTQQAHTVITQSTALGAYAMPVYERWAAAWGQGNGVGVNLADTSGGTVFIGSQSTTSLVLTTPIAGALSPGMNVAYNAASANNLVSTTAAITGTVGAAGSTYTITTNSSPANSVLQAQLGNASDVVTMTQTSGGFLYMFATNRYVIIQGKSFSNIQSNWLGCIEFERAQPEDAGIGQGTTTGITYSSFGTPTTTQVTGSSPAINLYPINPVEGVVQSLPQVAPWPCYAYVNGNRFPVGAQQFPTLPVAQQFQVHGNIFATPRVRNSAGDLVGVNAHVYSAATITTGRWGHLFELGGNGSYNNVTSAASGSILTTTNSTIVPHMGQIVPVYTNVYNSKRFMFSPVVVLGPTYDPDVRGRMYGIKVIPSALGTLMDTVSITVDNNWFYNTSNTAADHWVITTPPAGSTYGSMVTTYRIQAATAANTQITQSYRSLQDTATATASTSSAFTNDFRWAIPA